MKTLAVVALVGASLLVYKSYRGATAHTGAAEVLRTDAFLIGATIMQTPASNMRLSADGLNAIAQREGFAPTRYPDARGYSIGYGHFIKAGENFTEPMTRATASALLAFDAKTASDAVRAYVKVPLTQNQFDALTSFAYNVGTGAFRRSTLLAKLNSGDVLGAASEFDRWHIPAIVTARRDAEKAQFLA